jgi:2-hydroxy-6-oxonona-2,4-dienedioate hydrolase
VTQTQSGLFVRSWTHATVSANSLPVVLVHGLGVSSRYMIPTGERLGATRHVYAPDLPGFGLSQRPGQPLTIAEHADALATWMLDADLENPVLVANSYGCQVITELVWSRPGWVRAMVLNAPTIEASRRSAIGEMLRLVSDAPFERPRLLPIVIGDYLRAGPRRVLFTLRDALGDRIEDKLPHVTIPTLFVRGSRDPIVSDEWMSFLARRTPFGSTVRIDGAPHAVNFSAADAFCAEVGRFVDDVELELDGYAPTS